MDKIKRLNALTQREKFTLRVKNFLKLRTVAYALSAIAGVTAGNAVQDVSRNITRYNPTEHARILKGMAPKNNIPGTSIDNKNQSDRLKHDISEWFNKTWSKIKQAGVNPKEFIADTETYKTLLLKYYSVAKVVDDAAFLVPALLLFVMLGGYISRKLDKAQGDIVTKREHARMRMKINELVDSANEVMNKIDATGPHSLTTEETAAIRDMIKRSANCLPRIDEID